MVVGVQLEWILRKGDYSGTNAVTVDLNPARVVWQGTKELTIENEQAAPDEIDSDPNYPATLTFDTGAMIQTFKVESILANSATTWAWDDMHKVIDMYESARTGSLHLKMFSNASGTNTGSEHYQVNIQDYTFTQTTPGVDKVQCNLSLIAGSELV
jgi:hypothetical protein